MSNEEFKLALQENKVDEYLNGLNILELLNLKHSLGLTKIGEKSLEPLTEEEEHYSRIISKETNARLKDYKHK